METNLNELQILKDAQVLNKDPFIVLPELKITIHVYTLFVFNKILLKGKDTIENVFQELTHVNNPLILEALSVFTLGEKEESIQAAQFLESQELKYLQQFIISNSELLSDEDY